MPFAIARDKVRLHFSLHDFTDPWKHAPVLMLQHGFGRSSRFWYSLIPYLSRFHRIVCPDLRGLGESSGEFDLEASITVESYVADILSVADALGVQAFHYVGESLGGILGLALCAQHPARVSTLSLLATPLAINEWSQRSFAFGHPTWQDALRIMGPKGWSEAANTATRFPPGTDPGLLRWYSDEMGKSDVNVMIAMSRMAAKVNATPFLAQVKAPVLGLYPSGAKTIALDQETALRRGIPHIRFVRFPIASHMIWALEPASCADYILHFISLHDGTACRE